MNSYTPILIFDFPGGSDGKSVCLQCRRPRFDPWVGKIPWRRKWHPTPVLLPGKSHGRRSLVGYSPWGRKESDMTERLHFHFSLLCIGEGNGNPLQCSCLENLRDEGAWWAAVYGVAQSRTRLKRLSSSITLQDEVKNYTSHQVRLVYRIKRLIHSGKIDKIRIFFIICMSTCVLSNAVKS